MRGLLFLQLPQLDNDLADASENVPLASVYLRFALESSRERRYWETVLKPPAIEDNDDQTLTDWIVNQDPSAIACTLYVWNIERTLAVLRRVRCALPRVRIVAGGPEVARGHPFLFRSGAIDVAVEGEGEPVFADILKALRLGRTTGFRTVAHARAGSWTWGTREPESRPLDALLPPPGYPGYAPVDGMAYLETTRGCPLRCVYCRYPHQHRGISCLSVEEASRRIQAFREQGARGIRFIDPTFNANPAFEPILEACLNLNADRKLAFFAELNAATLTPRQARLLARARFMEVEVGVQSRDRSVLRRIRRFDRLQAVDRGIHLLLKQRIRVTVDLMMGLPGQTAREIERSVKWALRLPRADVQCLQTLLLPGTDIRRFRRPWGLKAMNRPPYGVLSTPTLSPTVMARTLSNVRRWMGVDMDCPTCQFVGRSMSDLFADRTTVRVLGKTVTALDDAQLHAARRAIVFHGKNLMHAAPAINRTIRQWVRQEPHGLWQFVFRLEWEEPLDLLEGVIATLRKASAHVLDRRLAVDTGQRMAARRVLIQLVPGRRYDPGWVAAINDLLRRCFF